MNIHEYQEYKAGFDWLLPISFNPMKISGTAAPDSFTRLLSGTMMIFSVGAPAFRPVIMALPV